MNNIIVTLLILSGAASAQDLKDGVYYWKNHNKKVFNYFVKPVLNLNVEKLNAGSDDYHAMISVSSGPGTVDTALLEKMADGYKLNRAALKSSTPTSRLIFVGSGLELEAGVLNTPSGPRIDDTIFITKGQYEMAKKAKEVLAGVALAASPLITYVAEKKSLPKQTCKDLGQEGAQLKNISARYLRLMEEIERDQYKYSETKDKLITAIDEKCFKDSVFKARSFNQLMNLKVRLSQGEELIEAKVVKDKYQNVDIELELKRTLELL